MVGGGLGRGRRSPPGFGRAKLFEAPFNASKLAAVKMAMKHAYDGFQIAGNSAELAHQHSLCDGIAWLGFQLLVRLSRSSQRSGDFIGVAGHLLPPHSIEFHELSDPAVQEFGQGQNSPGIVGCPH